MGTPLPANDHVTGCTLCFGSGKPLGSVQPKYVYVRFIDTELGDVFDYDIHSIPLGPYRLEHTTGCAYSFNDGVRQVRLSWGATRTRVYHRFPAGEEDYFFTIVGDLCQLDFEAVKLPASGTTVRNGSIEIRWPSEGL